MRQRRLSTVIGRSLRIRVILLAAAAVVLATPGTGAAVTYVSGTVSVNTTWTLAGRPYVASGNVTVNPAVTLTREPGVVVKLSGTTRTIFVNGVLNATGTGTSPITFTSLQDDSIAATQVVMVRRAVLPGSGRRSRSADPHRSRT
jgi:hypothetical protein